MDRCVNCGIRKRCNTMISHSLEDKSKLSIIRTWLAPKPVCSEDHVCNECWEQIKTLNESKNEASSELPLATTVGHKLVCVNCGRSLQNKYCHILQTTNDRECAVHNMIQTWITPQLLHTPSHICHSCWVRADRACRRRISRPPTFSNESELGQASPHGLEINTNDSESRTKEAIVLPDYIRAPETENMCFVEGCKRTERFRIPILLRRMLLSMHNYYVPLNNRLCSKHLATKSWDFLKNTKTHINMFNARHIQDMLRLKSMDI